MKLMKIPFKNIPLIDLGYWTKKMYGGKYGGQYIRNSKKPIDDLTKSRLVSKKEK